MEQLRKDVTNYMRAASGAKACGICDEYGHEGKNCSLYDPSKWCRVIGNNYHLTKNCTESKSMCSRCGMKDHHNVKIHSVVDKNKIKVLLAMREIGDPFDHFLFSQSGDGSEKAAPKKTEGGQEANYPAGTKKAYDSGFKKGGKSS